jgi:hypothetical protein
MRRHATYSPQFWLEQSQRRATNGGYVCPFNAGTAQHKSAFDCSVSRRLVKPGPLHTTHANWASDKGLQLVRGLGRHDQRIQTDFLRNDSGATLELFEETSE